jgi:hypothetical protein
MMWLIFVAALVVYLVVVTSAVLYEPPWLPVWLFSAFAFIGGIALGCLGQYAYNGVVVWHAIG